MKNIKEKFIEAIERATGNDLSDCQVESLWIEIKPLLKPEVE